MIAAISLSRDLLDAHELALSIYGTNFHDDIAAYIEILKSVGPGPISALHSVLKQFGGQLGDKDALLLSAAAVEMVIQEAKS